MEGYRMELTNAIVAISSGRCGDADAVVAHETWGIEHVNVNSSNVTNGSFDVAAYGFGTPLVGVAGSF